MTTGRTWPIHDWSHEAWHAREQKLNGFWQIFVDYRTVDRNAIDTHGNAQPKSVFSFCLGSNGQNFVVCEEERKLVGSVFAPCMRMLCDGRELREEYLKRRMLSIMESENWICEDAFEEHGVGNPDYNVVES